MVKVEAIQDPQVTTGSSYCIVARGQTSERDAYFDDAVVAVKQALAARGLHEVEAGLEPEVTVEVDFGVSPKRLKIVSTDPVFTPSEAEAPVAIVPESRPDGSIGFVGVPARKLGADGTYNGRTVMRGQFVYEKYLSIAARETAAAAGPTRAPREAWRVRATVEDEREGIVECLTPLAEAAAAKVDADAVAQPLPTRTLAREGIVVASASNGP